jgi:hypothetical protein
MVAWVGLVCVCAWGGGVWLALCKPDRAARDAEHRLRTHRASLTEGVSSSLHVGPCVPTGEIVCAGAMEPFDIFIWSMQVGRSGDRGVVLLYSLVTCQCRKLQRLP